MLKKSNSSKINWLKSKVNQSIPGISSNVQNPVNSRHQNASRFGQSSYTFSDESAERQLKSFISVIKRTIADGCLDTEKVSDLGSSVLRANVNVVCDNLRFMATMILSQNENFESNHDVFDIIHSEKFIEVMLNYTKFCLLRNDFVDGLVEEQLVLYEIFIIQSNQKFLMEKEFLRPLLELLDLCSTKLQGDWRDNSSLEEKFISTLHQICIGITTHSEILEMIFDGSLSSSNDKFSVFNLLVPFVHREGVAGQQARDALLLIMSLSAKHEKIGIFIANESNFCPVLATGLSGLYSSLPCSLDYPSDDWHHLSDEDVSHIPDLKMFLNSLEFCNAVVQASHPAVCARLLEFVLDGFLLPVVGPALNQTTIEEAVAATAYFDLFIRKITEPSLLKVFIDFVIFGKVDDVPVLDMLVTRISSQITRLCVVTLRLFHSLVDLNCEDVMFHLAFKHILPGKHIMLSQHHSMKEIDHYASDAGKFLSMIPECCHLLHPDDVSAASSETSFSSIEEEKPPSRLSRFHFKSKKSRMSFSPQTKKNGPSPKGTSVLTPVPALSGSFEDPSFVEYLERAHHVISSCRESCKNWLLRYETIQPVFKKEPEVASDGPLAAEVEAKEIGECDGDGLPSSLASAAAADDEDEDESKEKEEGDVFDFLKIDESIESVDGDSDLSEILKEIDHLYGRVCLKKEANTDDPKVEAEKKLKKTENYEALNELLPTDKPSIGPFLEAVFSRVERMVQSTLYVNLQLTSLVARLSCYPQPLLRTLVLSHGLVFQPSVKSFLQILNSVKSKLEASLAGMPQREACLSQAHQFLLYRASPDASLEVLQGGSRRRSSGLHELFKTSSSKQNRLTFSNSSAQYVHRLMTTTVAGGGSGEEGERESIERKNAIYAALVYREFLKELAAISLEHAVVCLS